MFTGIKNTTVANSTTKPTYSSYWDPIITAPSIPGKIQFSNISIVSAFFTQIDNVVSINIRLQVDVEAPGGEQTGLLLVVPPVHSVESQSAIGAMTTLSQIGLFGNLNTNGSSISIDVVNAAGVISVINGILQVLGSYVVV